MATAYADPFRAADLVATIRRWEKDGIGVSGKKGEKRIRCRVCGTKDARWYVGYIEQVFMAVEEHRQGRAHREMLEEVRRLRLDP